MDEVELMERLDKDVKFAKAKKLYDQNDKASEGNEERKSAMEVLQKERKRFEGETPEARYQRKTEDRDKKMKT